MNPTIIAKVILKVNVMLFVVTAGLSALTMFPYQLHLNQLANNIAIDVANRNYTIRDEVVEMFAHLNADPGDSSSNTFSLLTFKESNIKGDVKSEDTDSAMLADGISSGGITGFASEIPTNSDSTLLMNGGFKTVALNVETIGGGDSLIIDYSNGSFDPLNETDHLVDGMNGTNMSNNGKLVNRGVPFKVTLKSRFNFTMSGLGFRFNFGIPAEGVSVGVTTQYYQYD